MEETEQSQWRASVTEEDRSLVAELLEQTKPFATEDLLIRGVPVDIAARLRSAAGARGLTHAEYLVRLVQLHEAARAAVDAGGGDEIATHLEGLGLATLSV
jgi:hypothetical protein